jgi:predicted PurR-regulated permease PerM
MITAYLLFFVAALLMILLVALIWRFWQGFVDVSPEEEKLERSIASLNDSQANRTSDQQIARQMDTETGWQIMVRRGQRAPRGDRPPRRPRR